MNLLIKHRVIAKQFAMDYNITVHIVQIQNNVIVEEW